MLKALTILTASVIVSTGFIVGGMIFGDKLAREQTVTVGMPATMNMTSGTMGTSAQPAANVKALNIVHVQRGCHDWSDGKHMAATMRMMLAAGGTLRITDEDVDPHKLIQVAGPKVMLGKAMMTGEVAQISFPTKGVYKFTTRTLEMPGMEEVETIGPDNHLRLTVNVA
jgi:hypothetical protein